MHAAWSAFCQQSDSALGVVAVDPESQANAAKAQAIDAAPTAVSSAQLASLRFPAPEGRGLPRESNRLRSSPSGALAILGSFHASNNAFEVHVYQGLLDGGATLSRICQVDGTKYSWTANQWVRVTISWDFIGSGPAFHVYFNAQEVGGYITNGNAPFAIGANPGSGQKLYFGADGKTDSKHANGVLDELRIYDHPIVP